MIRSVMEEQGGRYHGEATESLHRQVERRFGCPESLRRRDGGRGSRRENEDGPDGERLSFGSPGDPSTSEIIGMICPLIWTAREEPDGP